MARQGKARQGSAWRGKAWIDMKRSQLVKMYRKMPLEDLKERLIQLQGDKSRFQGQEARKTGGLGKDSHKPRQIRKEIAMLKTIAMERGLRL